MACLATLASVVPATPAGAQPAGRIRFVPEDPGAYLKVEARYPARPEECEANQPRPLVAAYPGTIELGRRSNGRLFLVAELTFPEYLKGIAEVPRSWPLEALKAQVVAARTYAVANMGRGTSQARELGYDLCATDACQVYRGLVVERGPWGDRWAQAVDATAGQILEFDGRPASTFYFSTSNGRTYSNAGVWGGRALPYLKPVEETDDGASAVSRWSVRMPLGDVSEALRLDGVWAEGNVDQAALEGGAVVLSGGGRRVALPVKDFRAKLNKQAVCLQPKRYPSPGQGGRALPQVVPSEWFELRQEGADVVIDGRGWGHGVGMVQWGVKGKADRGMAYADILAFYYGGLRPVARPEPGAIRIGLTATPEEITVERVGAYRVEGASVGDGPVVFRGGDALTIRRGSPIEGPLRVDRLTSTGAAASGLPLAVSFELSGPANVSLRWRGPAEGETAPEPRERGPQTLAWDPLAAALPVGEYDVQLLADDGIYGVQSAPFPVKVSLHPPRATPSASPVAGRADGARRGAPAPGLLAGAAVLLAAVLGVGALARRRR